MMHSPLLLELALAFFGANSDSTQIERGFDASRKADSAWTDRPFYLEVSMNNNWALGDLLDEEQVLVDDLGMTVKSAAGKSETVKVLIQSYGLGVGFWKQFGPMADLGLGYRFHFEMETSQAAGMAEQVFHSNELALRGRYWVFRRLNYQIGPQVGFGWQWGVLNRFPLAKDATPDPNVSASDAKTVSDYLKVGNKDLSVNGSVVEFGGAMNVRIFPQLQVGGGILVIRRGLGLPSSDPLRNYVRGYPSSLQIWDFGVQLQGGVRF